MDYDKYDAVLHYVWGRTHGDAWFKPSEENVAAGVCLRVAPGKFRLFPYENHYLAPFEAAIRQLNPLIAVKVRSAAVHAALATVSDDAPAIYIDSDTRIQILDTVAHLVRADKEQCGAFIRDERVLVAWSDDFDDIIPLCHDFQDKLMKLVWRSRQVASVSVPSGPPSIIPSSTASDVNLTAASKAKDAVAAAAVADAAAAAILAEREKPKPELSWNFTWKLKSSDPERQSSSQARPMRMFAPVYAGLGAALSLFFISCGISMMISEYRLDHEYKRFFVLVTVPFLFCVSLFFSLQIITNVSFVLGPVAQYHENSKYYSAVSPEANPELDGRLPHVTVELPVYKESLEETIAPSIMSLKKAIQTYARQGGTSSIFVHDDGLQLVPENEKEKRISFYENHNIGWVARPPHSGDAHGYKRAGRFKKASNMNYGLALSLKMECKLKELAESGKDVYEEGLEDKALELAIEEVFQESGQRWRPWACNAKSLRMGDIILLVDSDTIVPEDCFRDAARELTECPDVAIIQHESDVMQVAHHYFENAVAHFTRRINRCISMGCANGEDAAFIDPDDGVKKIWSESNVSEDFDMALRLQLKGYIIRWATYSNGGFKEGVSLTVDDELNRWQKYSYGCNELIFNPLKDWWHAGPITKQLRVFLWSDAPVHYKITMMSYMFSYYGIAAAAVLSLINYCLLGWALDVDGFYMHSFEIWLACTVVFPGAGNLGYTLLEYRLGKRSILSSFIENITWIPFFFFFFGGLSMHLSVALLAHLFSYNITWGATAKEVERSTFFLEVPKIWKRYWQVLVVCFLIIAGMIVMSLPLIPEEWRIPGAYWGVIFPLAIVMASHILFPIVLNPWLMIFSY